MKHDSAAAWAAWAKNAPLDLLEYFDGELVAGPCGPHREHTVHLDVDSEGGEVAVNLHYHHDKDDE